MWQVLLRYPLKIAGEIFKSVLELPSVEATLKSIVKKTLTGQGEVYQRPQDLEDAASEILGLLKAHGITPGKIALDGLPGSGKSTLARILADRTGFTWVCFDHEDMDKPKEFTKNEVIYEHHRLFRTQPVDAFDVLVYMDRSVDECKARILKRGREALIIDLLDFDKLKSVGDKAFQACSGMTSPRLSGGALVKLRPEGGFMCDETLLAEAEDNGLTPNGWNKEELIHAILYGTPQKGLKAYLNVKALKEETLSVAISALERLGYEYLNQGKQASGQGRH